MTHGLPRMTIRKSMLVVALVAVLFSIPSCAESVLQTLRDTTVYAPGYSEKRFRSIRLGMTDADLIQIMGQPFEDKSSGGYVNWYYGPPTLKVAENGSVSGPDYTYVRADGRGTIDAAAGSYLNADWNDLVGLDLTRCASDMASLLRYAHMKNGGISRTREPG